MLSQIQKSQKDPKPNKLATALSFVEPALAIGTKIGGLKSAVPATEKFTKFNKLSPQLNVKNRWW